jgi:hypothetical protein
MPEGWVVLYWKDKPIGMLDPVRGLWYVIDTGAEVNLQEHLKKANPRKLKEGTSGTPAVREEDEPQKKEQSVLPLGPGSPIFGVDHSKISSKEKYYKDGRICSRAEALAALSKIRSADGVPVDSDSVRITIIGSESQTLPVYNDLMNSPDLSWLKGKSLIQRYAPDHWRIQSGGFVNSGTPTIYCQKSDGTVLWRQDNYDGGAPKLSAALRDKVPGYDPLKDPTPAKPNAAGKTTFHYAWFIAIGCILVFLYLRNKKNSTV